jgi:hypothetical protein
MTENHQREQRLGRDGVTGGTGHSEVSLPVLRSGAEVPFWEITVDLTISDLRVLCIWNSGDPSKNI